jgi:exopolysaccharide production protein ExoY
MSSLVEIDKGFALSPVEKARPVGLSFKRLADIVIASSAIFLLAPLLAICAIVNYATTGSVLFRHSRVGFGGRRFNCLKFQTMVPDAAERLRHLLESDPAAAAEWELNRKLRNDPRVTTIGAILRKSSLDELPQLFNVLKGDMSIVGPRPVTEEEMKRYANAVTAYYSCRPGITGLWQVSGRSSTTFSKRVACDSFYARNWSVGLDAWIIVATIPAVCFSQDTAY